MRRKLLKPGVFRLTLFVVGGDTNSKLAQDNLQHICGEHLNTGTCEIVVVDILDDFQAALDNDILVAPTLVVEGPRGRSTILGNLSDIDRIVMTIGANR